IAAVASPRPAAGSAGPTSGPASAAAASSPIPAPGTSGPRSPPPGAIHGTRPAARASAAARTAATGAVSRAPARSPIDTAAPAQPTMATARAMNVPGAGRVVNPVIVTQPSAMAT